MESNAIIFDTFIQFTSAQKEFQQAGNGISRMLRLVHWFVFFFSADIC